MNAIDLQRFQQCALSLNLDLLTVLDKQAGQIEKS